MKPIDSPDQIPEFESEDEEARFWDEHELGEGMLSRMQPTGDDLLPPPRPPSQPISLRLDPHLLARLKTLAARRGQRYQSLLKQFVIERLYEEEKREPDGYPDAK